MRISIDLTSVQDTARVLAAAADEYDRTAMALQAGDGLGGVTGSQRYWLFSAVESVAARVRAVAGQHRATAADLLRRCECVADNVSPTYAGIAVAGAPIAFDRNGDGINDTFAVDGDGDGFFESFVLDTEQDGIYDLVLISDLSGTLQAAYVGGAGQPAAAGGFGTGFSSYGTPADESPFGGGAGIFTGTGFSSYGTPASTTPFGGGVFTGTGFSDSGGTTSTTPFGGSGGIFTGQMGYIASPSLSGMTGGSFGSGILDTGSTRSPFLNSSASRDYGKLPSYQEWSNSPRIDSDGDGINNRWDNEFKNRDRG